jgi:hypothetical protein
MNAISGLTCRVVYRRYFLGSAYLYLTCVAFSSGTDFPGYTGVKPCLASQVLYSFFVRSPRLKTTLYTSPAIYGHNNMYMSIRLHLAHKQTLVVYCTFIVDILIRSSEYNGTVQQKIL